MSIIYRNFFSLALRDPHNGIRKTTTKDWKTEGNLLELTIQEEASQVVQIDLSISGNKIKEVLEHDDENADGNLLHAICAKPSKDPDLILRVLKWLLETYGLDTMKVMLDTTNYADHTVLNIISVNQDLTVLNKFWGWMVEILKKPAQDVLPPQSKRARIEFASEGSNETLKSFDELIKMTSLDYPYVFLRILKLSVLDTEMFQKLLGSFRDSRVENFWGKFSKDIPIVKDMIVLMKDYFPDDIRNCLLNADEEGNTFLLAMATNTGDTTLNRFVGWLETEFSPAFIYSLIWKKNSKGEDYVYRIRNMIGHTVRIIRWRMGKADQEVWDEVNRELIEYVTEKKLTCQNLADMVTSTQTEERLVDILEFLTEINSEKNFFKVMNCSVTNKQTILMLFLEHEKIPVRTFFKVLKDKYGREGLKKLIARVDVDRGNVLTYSFKYLSKDRLFDFITFWKETFGQRQTEDLMLNRDLWKWNALKYLAEENQKVTAVVFLKFAKEKFGLPFVRKLVENRDIWGRTFLLRLNLDMNESSLMELLEFLRGTFGLEFAMRSMYSKHGEKETFVNHVETTCRNVATLPKLKAFIVKIALTTRIRNKWPKQEPL